MARRGSPALYELLGRSRDPKGSGASASAGNSAPKSNAKPIPSVQTVVPINIPPRKQGSGMQIGSKAAIARAAGGDAASARSSGSLGAGLDPRVMRIGGIAIVAVALLVGVYLLGVSRGTGSGAERGTDTSDGAASVSGAQQAAVTPTQQATDQPARASRDAGQSTAPRQSAATPTASENPQRGAVAALDPDLGPPLPPATKGVDPRQAGLQYCVIASVLEANADKLVQFCRERGLDAWVVPDHNGRLREITVLPGLPRSELKGPAATALDARIRKVGALWKAAGRGNSDFEDRYFKPFNG